MVARYASQDTMLQDAEWFDSHAQGLEEKARRFRRLATACRAVALPEPPHETVSLVTASHGTK